MQSLGSNPFRNQEWRRGSFLLLWVPWSPRCLLKASRVGLPTPGKNRDGGSWSDRSPFPLLSLEVRLPLPLPAAQDPMLVTTEWAQTGEGFPALLEPWEETGPGILALCGF
ncbi:hypothetical protein H1C71_038524 [Ictidomys tridecemlineatus]|nr:hypothetical protein H1C71_038524 [Ictidomys tridecemlineatus]